MPKIRGLRWWMIGLIMTGSIINYLTRSTLSVAAPTILTNLKISTAQYSWIVGAFQGTIMLQPVCGYVLDSLGLKAGFAIFAAAWALVNMAHGLAGSWRSLAFLRGLLGFCEGAANPAGMKAMFQIGASVGAMLAPPLSLAGFAHQTLSGPNFTGAFVGVCCHDLSGGARSADFGWFEYRERGYEQESFGARGGGRRD